MELGAANLLVLAVNEAAIIMTKRMPRANCAVFRLASHAGKPFNVIFEHY